jgi:hypothetical protein
VRGRALAEARVHGGVRRLTDLSVDFWYLGFLGFF